MSMTRTSRVALVLMTLLGAARPALAQGGGHPPPPPPADPAITYIDGGSSGSLWVMNADGTNKVRKVQGGTWGGSWTPDGQKIVFGGSLAGSGIYVFDLATNSWTKIVSTPNDSNYRCRVSHGLVGSTNPQLKIAACYRDVGRIGTDLFIMNLDGSGLVRLTNLAMCHGPSWDPTSSRVVVTEASSVVTYDIVESGATFAAVNRTVLNASGPLVNTLGNELEWGPNGQIAGSFDNGTGNQIWLISGPGAAYPVTSGSLNHQHPSWSPDGSRLLLRQPFGNKTALGVLDLSTLVITQLGTTTMSRPEWRDF